MFLAPVFHPRNLQEPTMFLAPVFHPKTLEQLPKSVPLDFAKQDDKYQARVYYFQKPCAISLYDCFLDLILGQQQDLQVLQAKFSVGP